MDKKNLSEFSQQQFKEKFKERTEREKTSRRKRTFDELYKDKCYIVKDGADSYKLEHLPTTSTRETGKYFQTGDRVKNQYGRLLTVLVQLENLVIVKEEVNNYNPKDLTMIERAADTYQV